MDRKFNLCWVGPRARGPEVIVLNVYYYHHDVLQIVVFISASHQNGKFIHLSDRLFVANISERQALIQIINNKIYHDTSLSLSLSQDIYFFITSLINVLPWEAW